MLQVNQSSTSVNNFVNFLSVESSINSHMELTLYKTTSDNRTLKKTILIFTGYEYDVSFYDFESGTRKTITGIIESIDGDNTDANSQYITMKYWPTSNNCTCNTTNSVTSTTRTIPGCGCILNNKESNTDKYQSPEIINIYIANITDMNYTANCCNNNIPEQPKKKGERVVLLGISANIVKAIIVNLKLIDDSFEDAIKDITMETGKIYNIAYLSKKDKAIYEFTGKLVAIKETNQAPSNNSIVRTCEGYGLNNSIYEYDVCGSNSDKDTYMSSDSMKNDVLLTFDTSTNFSGEFESIMLSWIRDCTFIGDGTNPFDIYMNEDCYDDSTNSTNSNGCNCSSGVIKMKSGNCTTVIIDPAKNNVHFSHNGNIGDITLQELVDFYFCSC